MTDPHSCLHLYSYNLREKDLSVAKVAYHRALSVTIGVVWAALVSRFWWPAEARRELSKALGEYVIIITFSSIYGSADREPCSI